jgi:hypothetical protein
LALLQVALNKLQKAFPDLQITILSINLIASKEEKFVCNWEAEYKKKYFLLKHFLLLFFFTILEELILM